MLYTDFPRFKNQTVDKIFNVEASSVDNFYWPDMDIDLTIESIEHPEL